MALLPCCGRRWGERSTAFRSRVAAPVPCSPTVLYRRLPTVRVHVRGWGPAGCWPTLGSVPIPRPEPVGNARHDEAEDDRKRIPPSAARDACSVDREAPGGTVSTRCTGGNGHRPASQGQPPSREAEQRDGRSSTRAARSSRPRGRSGSLSTATMPTNTTGTATETTTSTSSRGMDSTAVLPTFGHPGSMTPFVVTRFKFRATDSPAYITRRGPIRAASRTGGYRPSGPDGIRYI